MTLTDTFTHKCPWGCTIHVVSGHEQPHACDGTSRIVDLMRVSPASETVLEMAERLARGLDEALRIQSHDAWVTGVRDGRSGQQFYGVDEIGAQP